LRGRNSLLIMGPGELRRRLVLLTRDVHRHTGTRVVVKTGSGGPEERVVCDPWGGALCGVLSKVGLGMLRGRHLL
jgi:hypothetical protein